MQIWFIYFSNWQITLIMIISEFIFIFENLILTFDTHTFNLSTLINFEIASNSAFENMQTLYSSWYVSKISNSNDSTFIESRFNYRKWKSFNMMKRSFFLNLSIHSIIFVFLVIMFLIVKLLVIVFEIFEIVVVLLILVALAVARYFDRLLRRCLFASDNNFIAIFAIFAITRISISFFSIAISKTLIRTRNFVDFRNFFDFCNLLSDIFSDFCNFLSDLCDLLLDFFLDAFFLLFNILFDNFEIEKISLREFDCLFFDSNHQRFFVLKFSRSFFAFHYFKFVDVQNIINVRYFELVEKEKRFDVIVVIV